MDRDFYEVGTSYKELGLEQKRMKDGTWKIKSSKQMREDEWRWSGDEHASIT